MTLAKPVVTELWERAAARLKAAGIESPALEAQLLTGLALGTTRAQVLLGSDVRPSPEQLAEIERFVSARESGTPLAYLRGTQEFYGLTFEVTPAVLIPRPETELLVDIARERLGAKAVGTLVDVGTGSGCVAVAAATALPLISILSIDISRDALDVAGRNASANGVHERVSFIRADLLDAVATGAADAIVANPPYIPSGEIAALQVEVRDHEPRLALDGGADGLAIHRRLASDSRRVLKPGGWLAVETAMGQAPVVAGLLIRSGFEQVETRHDLAGIARIVVGVQAR